MREEDEALEHTIQLFDELRIGYAVGGLLSSAHYGEPRATLDTDIVADLNLAQLAQVLAGLPKKKFYFSESAAKEALRAGGQFSVIHIGTSSRSISSSLRTGKHSNRLRALVSTICCPGFVREFPHLKS